MLKKTSNTSVWEGTMNIRKWEGRYYIEMRLLYHWLMKKSTSLDVLLDEKPIIVQALFARDHIEFFEYVAEKVYRKHYLDNDEKKLFLINTTIIELRYKRGAEIDFRSAIKDEEFSGRIKKAFKCIGGIKDFEDDYEGLFMRLESKLN